MKTPPRSPLRLPVLFLALAWTLPAPARAAQAEDDQNLNTLRQELAKHPFFMRLTYNVGADAGGFLLLVQTPKGVPPEFVQEVSDEYAPWLQELWEILEREYLWPVGLPRSRGSGPIPVWIADSQASFKNIARYGKAIGRHGDKALYYPQLRLVVAYKEASARKPVPAEDRAALLEELTHEVLRNYHQAEGERPGDAWYTHGLASYLAAGAGADPKDLGNPPLDRAALDTFKGFLNDPEKREVYAMPLADLCRGINEKAILSIFRTRAMEFDVSLPTPETVDEAMYSQAVLWVDFLHRGADGKYRRALTDYLGPVLTGLGGPVPLAEALDVDDLATVDAEFLAYVEGLAAGGKVPEPKEQVGGVVTPRLLVEPETLDAWMATGLIRARRGDVDGAIAHFQMALTELSGDTERVQRELERLETLRATRDSFLSSLVGAKTRLRAELPQGKLSSVVEKVEDGQVFLGKNSLKVETLAVNAIPIGDLADTMGNKVSEHGPAWVAPYCQLLAGEERWDRDLAEDGEAEAALHADAAAEWDTWMHFGEASDALHALARAPLPSTVDQATSLSEGISALMAEYGDVPAVEEKRGLLRGLASRSWSVVYDVQGLQDLVAGKVTSAGRDKVKITYLFDDEAEGEDFEKVEGGYLAERHDELPAVKRTPGASRFEVKKGALEGQGQTCFRHKLGFETPITIRYDLLYGRAKPDEQANFRLGLCDDGKENYIGALNVFDMEAIDLPTRMVELKMSEGDKKLNAVKAYRVEVHHDGTAKATMEVNGKPQNEVQVGARKSGQIFLWIHSDVPISLEKLEIEGRVSKAVMEAGRFEWVEAKLAGMNL